VNVNLPKLRSGSAMRNRMIGQPTKPRTVDVDVGRRRRSAYTIAGDAQEARGGTHVVAGKRQTVLEAGDADRPAA
jgi:hypothetical protein